MLQGGLSPKCPRHLAPPRRRRHGIYHEFRKTVFWDLRPKDKRPTELLSIGYVPRSLHELRKFAVCHGVSINEKRRQLHLPSRASPFCGTDSLSSAPIRNEPPVKATMSRSGSMRGFRQPRYSTLLGSSLAVAGAQQLPLENASRDCRVLF